MDNDEKRIDLYLTTEEARTFVNKINREASGTFCLMIMLPARIPNTDQCYESGLSSYVHLKRKDALRIVSSLMSERIQAKGGRIRIYYYENSKREKPIYWIG